MHISINKHNDTRLKINYQENFKSNSEKQKYTVLWEYLFGLSGKLKHKGPSRVMQIILREAFVRTGGPSIELSNNYLARSAEMSIRQLQRTNNILKQYNAISITPHPYYGMNVYNINIFFFDNVVRADLCHLVDALNDDWLREYQEESKTNKEIKKRNFDTLCRMKWQKMQLDKQRHPHLSKHTLSDMSLIEYHNSEELSSCNGQEVGFQKVSPFSNMNNIYINNLSQECDDGAVLTAEPDWLVAAGTPFESNTVSVFKKKSLKQEKEEAVLPSLDISTKKSSSSQYQHGVSTMKHETLYSKTILAVAAELKSIRPTIWGQIKMSAYPDEAILYADKQLLKGKGIKDKFSYFMGICKKYCEEKGLTVDWLLMIKLGQKYSMPNDGPWIDENFVSDNPPTVASKKQTVSQKLNSQWKDNRPDIDREKEFFGAQAELREKAQHNPFAAILLGSMDALSKEKKKVESPVSEPLFLEVVPILQSIDTLALQDSKPSLATYFELITEHFDEYDESFEQYDLDPFGDRK